jgi:ribose 5-phosphate isomerase A
MSADLAKVNAAAAALDYVRDGMVLGLGTGSTAAHFVRLLGERVRRGLTVTGVATSQATQALAEAAGVPIIDIDKTPRIDLAIDGADEIDPKLRLIKGGGGALLREKIVAAASAHFIVIVDENKDVDALGAFPLPIEVTPFGFTLAARAVYEALRAEGCPGTEVALREGAKNGQPLVTDGGNYILDAKAQLIPDPESLAARLKRIPGLVEHGLFLGLTRTAIIGHDRGVEVREA